jgi:hypothetical protein
VGRYTPPISSLPLYAHWASLGIATVSTSWQDFPSVSNETFCYCIGFQADIGTRNEINVTIVEISAACLFAYSLLHGVDFNIQEIYLQVEKLALNCNGSVDHLHVFVKISLLNENSEVF